MKRLKDMKIFDKKEDVTKVVFKQAMKKVRERMCVGND
jgi:hypothetical protein